MPTALWIAHVQVTDAEAYGKYAALAGPAIAAHGGYFLARGSRTAFSVHRFFNDRCDHFIDLNRLWCDNAFRSD